MKNFNYTKEEVIKAYQIIETVKERMTEVGSEVGFFTQEFDTPEESKYEIDVINNEFSLTAYDSHYDMYDADYCTLPLDFLFENAENHKDYIKKQREEQKREREEAERKRKEESERKEYEKLKQKFESN